MKIHIKSKNREQRKRLIEDMTKAITHQFSLCGVSNMLYNGSKLTGEKGNKEEGFDFSGCSIRVIDLGSDTDTTKEIKG